MKSGVHPIYNKVLFVDGATGDEWVSYSTMEGSDSRVVDGEGLDPGCHGLTVGLDGVGEGRKLTAGHRRLEPRRPIRTRSPSRSTDDGSPTTQ